MPATGFLGGSCYPAPLRLLPRSKSRIHSTGYVGINDFKLVTSSFLCIILSLIAFIQKDGSYAVKE